MEKYSIQFKTISNLRNKQLGLLNVNEIINVINVNGGSGRKVTPQRFWIMGNFRYNGFSPSVVGRWRSKPVPANAFCRSVNNTR